MRRWLLHSPSGLLAILLVIVGLPVALVGRALGQVRFSFPPLPAPAYSPPVVRPDLEVVSDEWGRSEYGGRIITGTVRNNSGHAYEYVHIDISLYDDSKAQVGNAFTVTTNLDAGREWKFEAIVLDSRATLYIIKDVSGN